MSIYRYRLRFISGAYIGALSLFVIGWGCVIWPAWMNHETVWELPIWYLAVAISLGPGLALWFFVGIFRTTRPLEITSERIGQRFFGPTLRRIGWVNTTLIEVEKTAPKDVGIRRLRIKGDGKVIVITFSIQNRTSLINEINLYAKTHQIPIRVLLGNGKSTFSTFIDDGEEGP